MPDWSAIQTEYITGDLSYRKLAENWGVPFRTLTDRALREGWSAARKAHRNTVVEKTVQKVQNRKASENANHLLKLQEAADNMSEVIAGVFNDTVQFHRHLVGQMSALPSEKTFQKVNTRAIRDLTGAIKDLAVVMRNLYDLPTAQEQAAMNIAAERLKLEKAKAEREAQHDDEGGEVSVEFFNAEEEGWSE